MEPKDLIIFLLDRLHKELNLSKSQSIINSNNSEDISTQLDKNKMLNIFIDEFKEHYKSIISDLFYGVHAIANKCSKCFNTKYNFQVYNFIEFHLEAINQFYFENGKRNNYSMYNNKNPDIDLYECFDYLNRIDLINGNNKIFCNICNYAFESYYQSSLFSIPNYLIIILDRGKIDLYQCNVNFPETLYLYSYAEFKSSNLQYELYSVICPLVESSKKDHFVAYCKNRLDKKWYLYDDDLVSLSQNPSDFKKDTANILFYKITC